MSACVDRVEPVLASHLVAASERTTARQHYETTQAYPELVKFPEKLTLIDDVVTKGATLIGVGSVLQKAFPTAEIRAFAVFSTLSFTPSIGSYLFRPLRNRIDLFMTGKTFRHPEEPWF